MPFFNIDITAAAIGFTFYFPLGMAYIWMTGAIYYRLHWERNTPSPDCPPELSSYEGVSILVPCFNEENQIGETLASLLDQDYPNFEVIAINDGSSDNTGQILGEIASREPRLRVIHFAKNQGKAMALCMGALMSPHEFLICVDGDVLLDRHASRWIMHHFITGPRVGAVTGNPRIRNRSTLLGKIQVGEFSAIIGLIKRCQRIYGRVFTLSGAVAGFRKQALHRCGYWNTDMVTEDIDISWRLQLNCWDIRFEPNALCWILMPETLHGLWRQRVRWAQGGAEVFFRYFSHFFSWRKRRMWLVYIEYSVSAIWSYMLVCVFLLWLLGKFIVLPSHLHIATIVPGWTGVILSVTCLIQFAVSLLIDNKYERNLGKFYYWMIWYPMLYWMINVTATFVGIPKAILKRKGKRATWISPDRGLQQLQAKQLS